MSPRPPNRNAVFPRDAACKGKPTSWWFAFPRTPEYELAKQYCDVCPVSEPCAEEARAERLWGRWGDYVHLGSRADKAGGKVTRFELGDPECVCDGCGVGFGSWPGMRSHQAQKQCGAFGQRTA